MSKAFEAERETNGGKAVWQCIRDMQYGRRRLTTAWTAAVCGEEDNIRVTAEAEQQNWQRHFSTLLNVQSSFVMEKLEKARQRRIRTDMADPPTE